jgi:GxxExxY protein
MNMEFDSLSKQIIGCALQVHLVLGPGLLESTYEQCLAHELSLASIPFKRQVSLPVKYKNVIIDCGYRIDVLVKDKLIIEIKSVEKIINVHRAQLLTYMKLSGIGIGLLMNFNVELFKTGLKRFVI